MNKLLPSSPEEEKELSPNKSAYGAMRSEVASLLGSLMSQPIHGRRVELILGSLLPPGMVAAIYDGPGIFK